MKKYKNEVNVKNNKKLEFTSKKDPLTANKTKNIKIK